MINQHYPVLLVEDDPNDIFLIERAFRKANVSSGLRIVRNGEEALNYLLHKPPYEDKDAFPSPWLILLDLKVPRKSGLELLGWIRQHHKLHRLPVLVLSSSNAPHDINRAYDLGANSYLVKPVEFSTLVDMVRMIDEYWLALCEKPTLE